MPVPLHCLHISPLLKLQTSGPPVQNFYRGIHIQVLKSPPFLRGCFSSSFRPSSPWRSYVILLDTSMRVSQALFISTYFFWISQSPACLSGWYLTDSFLNAFLIQSLFAFQLTYSRSQRYVSLWQRAAKAISDTTRTMLKVIFMDIYLKQHVTSYNYLFSIQPSLLNKGLTKILSSTLIINSAHLILMSSPDHDQQSSSRPFVYFGVYCLGGVSLLSYISYRGFTSAANTMKIAKPVGERLKLSSMGSRRGILKALGAMGIYLTGFIYLAMKLNLGDRAFQSMIRRDEEYTAKYKTDPFFQRFFILNTMRYFGISDRLVKKTEEELRSKVEGEGKKTVQGVVKFEKQVAGLVQYFGGQRMSTQ